MSDIRAVVVGAGGISGSWFGPLKTEKTGRFYMVSQSRRWDTNLDRYPAEKYNAHICKNSLANCAIPINRRGEVYS